MPAQAYVHGYNDREARRLDDQAGTLARLLHHDTAYPPGSRVLEAGCGTGAQTGFLTANSPGAHLTCLEKNPDSLDAARRRAREADLAAGLGALEFVEGDLYRPPFPAECFDHIFVCFVLEHLPDPEAGLASLLGLLKPGGTLTAIEGDHGSCYYHPATPLADAAWRCLIDSQALLGGDSLIGRRLYPLLAGAGLAQVQVTPRLVYCDASRPAWVEGFVRRTIVPMVAGVREQALELGLMDEAAFDQGLQDLLATGEPGGAFNYTFFKGVGVKV